MGSMIGSNLAAALELLRKNGASERLLAEVNRGVRLVRLFSECVQSGPQKDEPLVAEHVTLPFDPKAAFGP